ncbi:hypothetical protein QWI17_05980 [Gilvimarinus sp. SDUM040013]|uniref:Uncharacterized protein n=1 Tax=Gilvimarinus gilvus TaxID=3058038 RepID=A0ABU4S199_9GAMM|nr:hypothetical protein [Gilvimarinus sp. SDUM040013]MDO3385388.1 hypothetical protein [Gilvimarinus sp. SDUM040013]MDX6850964.1 hypothetical protein [Gilvimarinus sp. SDUM040013]
MKQWNELDVFNNVDLQDSFVIGWKRSDETFFIDMEASLWPGHPDYEAPEKNEHTCYKKARLLFRSPYKIRGLLPIDQVNANEVMENEIPDYDTIDSFEIGNGQFHLVGSFGDVTLSAKDWTFKVVRRLVPESN